MNTKSPYSLLAISPSKYLYSSPSHNRTCATHSLASTLPFTKDSLSKKYGLDAAREAGKKVVLVSPSVYSKSFLTNQTMIEGLIKLQAAQVVPAFMPKVMGLSEYIIRSRSRGSSKEGQTSFPGQTAWLLLLHL